jgi:ArsR family transcriptional regulator, arsenate/arsenite/antimonite-responsive transcriptional repressor
MAAKRSAVQAAPCCPGGQAESAAEPGSGGQCTPRKARLKPRALKQYGRLFKAMGDETRLEMLGLLVAARGELCVCDIEKHFDLTQPTISHHLRVLRDADLVTSDRRGTWVYYAINEDTVALLLEVHAGLSA